LGEFIPGFEARTWQGLGAPKHLPTEIAKADIACRQLDVRFVPIADIPPVRSITRSART